MSNRMYGYCRISTNKQNIERQVRNILREYPNTVIIKEVYTGTKINRSEFDKLLKAIKPGDTVIFDSVSRMSRDAEEGIKLYEELFIQHINLVFIKEPHINTETYKKALTNNIELTGTKVDCILEAINEYLMLLAKEQIKLAFSQAQKEVDDLHQRTREGIDTARLNGKQIGQRKGAKLNIKKSAKAKELIIKYSKNFKGNLKDTECIKLIGITKNTFYKYKKELKEV